MRNELFSESDVRMMRMALEEAAAAAAAGEVPVGAVIAQGDRTVARAHNLTETRQSAVAHAEVLAIGEACRALGRRRLSDCTLYVTLEPCPMCAGALIGARIGRVVFASRDARAGALGSLLDLRAYPLESRPTCACGLLADEAQTLLRDFFADLRHRERGGTPQP